MKKKKAFTFTLIGLFIFLFGVIGITYAYWQLTLKQTDENLVYTDCLKLTVNWGDSGFQLTGAYPMTNEELVSDFFPNTTPYHFTIENKCDNEVPISINMESITATDPQLKDDYVDVILWEGDETDVFNPDDDKVLSHESNTDESKYKLIDNAENKSMIADDAKKAYQLYKFKLPGKKEDGSTDKTNNYVKSTIGKKILKMFSMEKGVTMDEEMKK